MPLERNDTFDIVYLATVEELLVLSNPDALNSGYPTSDDAQRTPVMMHSSYYLLIVISEATYLVSRLSLLLFVLLLGAVQNQALFASKY